MLIKTLLFFIYVQSLQAHTLDESVGIRKSIQERLEKLKEALQDERINSLIDLESEHLPLPHHIEHSHPQLSVKMRSILISWLGEVADDFGLSQNTYFRSVQIVDRFLTTLGYPKKYAEVARSKLQLAGLAAIKLAAILNEECEEVIFREHTCKPAPPFSPGRKKLSPEISPSTVSYLSNVFFAYLSDGAYTPSDVAKMLRYMANKLDHRFALNATPDFWVAYYLNRLGLSSSDKESRTRFILIYTLCMKALSLSVLDSHSLYFAPSELAFATVQHFLPDAPLLVEIDPSCLTWIKNRIKGYEDPMAMQERPRNNLASAEFGTDNLFLWFRHYPDLLPLITGAAVPVFQAQASPQKDQ